MTVKFLSSTNKNYQALNNIEMNIIIDIVVYMKFNPMDIEAKDVFEFRHGTSRTSMIKQINYKEISMGCYEITIQTNNNIYIFQKGKKTNEKPLTLEEKEILSISTLI
jgi:hypothetical protein